MRCGPRAGATRSKYVAPSLRPGPRASRADLNIIQGDYVSSGGPAPLSLCAALLGSKLCAARTVSPAMMFDAVTTIAAPAPATRAHHVAVSRGAALRAGAAVAVTDPPAPFCAARPCPTARTKTQALSSELLARRASTRFQNRST